MIWDRERYIAHSLFEDTGREMFCELFGPLNVLEKEWRLQGATEAEIAMKAFDWDYVPTISVGGDIGARTGITPRVLEDTPEVKLAIDHFGRRTKLIKSSGSLPLPLDYPVVTPDDWERVKPWYTFDESRVPSREQLLANRREWDNGRLTIMYMLGAFAQPRELMGDAELCIAYYEEPEMITDMLETFADTAVKVIERVCDVVPLDVLFVHEDMAGKNGPLVGPKQIKEFFKPYYTRVWDAAKAHGAKLFSQDSDGDISPVLDDLIDCGLNAIHPMEPTGNNDIVTLRKKYGKKLCFKGGIDKFALMKGKEAVKAELEYRMAPHLLGGGTIFGNDHRIPNGVHIDTYRYYVNLGREILGLEPISGEGWGRMAF